MLASMQVRDERINGFGARTILLQTNSVPAPFPVCQGAGKSPGGLPRPAPLLDHPACRGVLARPADQHITTLLGYRTMSARMYNGLTFWADYRHTRR